MCLALPAKILSIDETTDMAVVAIGETKGGVNNEVKKEVSIALIEDARINDFVLIHVGYALNKISAEEAERTLQLFAEAGLSEPLGEHLSTNELSAEKSFKE